VIRNQALILLLSLMITSCFKEDVMVPSHQQGNLEVGQASQGSNYERQVFYDLDRNVELRSNVISAWDLCIESIAAGGIIRLNSSKHMVAGNSYDTTFLQDLAKGDLDMRFDSSDGHPDSTAIGAWFIQGDESMRSHEYVYLVDRGRDEFNKKMGVKKVQFKTSGTDYLVRHANSDNTEELVSMISWNDDSGPVYYSFDSGIVDIAPQPAEWSLLFSKYTTMLQTNEGEDYPYLVTGVLLNPNGVTAALDTIHEFDDIELSDTIDLQLTMRTDVIGYEWKYYNFDEGVYTIVPGLHYLIRDRDGFYYKFRFIDFYNDTGEKGYPKFEYIRL